MYAIIPGEVGGPHEQQKTGGDDDDGTGRRGSLQAEIFYYKSRKFLSQSLFHLLPDAQWCVVLKQKPLVGLLNEK